MSTSSKTYLKIYLLGTVVLLILGAFALLFYKERMMSFDPSFFAFLMIDNNDYSIVLGRWGAVFSEILPLYALKGGCTLQTFLQLFSIAPILNYIIIFTIIVVVLKHRKAALLLLLVLTLCFRHAFYYTTAELYLGLALSVLMWALLSPEEPLTSNFKKRTSYFLVLLIIYTSSYLHQLTLFTTLFVFGTELILNKRYKDYPFLGLMLIGLAWYFIRIFVFKASDYEAEKMPSLNVFIEQLPKLRYLPSTIYFKLFSIKEFVPVFFISLALTIYYVVKKQWLYTVFIVVFNISYLVLILITYYKGESPLMYENYYVLFGLFVGLPFILMLETHKKEFYKFSIYGMLLTYSLIGIYNSHCIFTKKIEYLQRLVNYAQTQPNKKFLVNTQNFNWTAAWVSWSLPFETTLLSSENSHTESATFFVASENNKYDSLLNKPNIFLGPEWSVTWFSSNNLKKQFFNFPSSGYVKLNTSQADTSFHEEYFNVENVFLTPTKRTYTNDADSFLIVPIKITNTSKHLLASMPDVANPIRLSYHIYDKDGKEIEYNGIRTPLEADIITTYTTGMKLMLPPKKGSYKVVVDLLTENKRWWNINSEFILEVN